MRVDHATRTFLDGAVIAFQDLTLEVAPNEALCVVGRSSYESMYPYQLSGGMQQRAGLARALVLNPQVLLMDEPFGALDAQTRELLQEELVRILEQDERTMVFITHSIDEAIVLGDRIVVMSARPGRVREVLDVGLPRPRNVQAARTSER